VITFAPKFLSMRAIFLITGILIISMLSCQSPEQKPAPKRTTSIHSKEFNQSIQNLLNNYYALTEAFVKWDSAAINSQAGALSTSIDSVYVTELQKDASGSNEAVNEWTEAKNDLNKIKGNGNITDKRHQLNSLTLHLFNFLEKAKYDASTLYLQQCPMAFNDKDTGVWISKTTDIRNPYMGLHHPQYGKGMLECGETRDSLDIISSK
jgi:hypothetical protein